MITNDELFNLIFDSKNDSEFDSKLNEMLSEPSETIKALKFCIDSRKNKPLTEEQINKISSIYSNVFTKFVNNLDDKKSINFFLLIRSISLGNNSIFDIYKKSIIPILMEKRKEIPSKLKNSEIKVDDLIYINDFLKMDVKSLKPSKFQDNELREFTKLVLKIDPKNISKYDSIQDFANSILNSINKNKTIDSNYIMYFVELAQNGVGLTQDSEGKFINFLSNKNQCSLTDINANNFSSFSDLFELLKNDTLPEKYRDSINTLFSDYISKLKEDPKKAVSIVDDIFKNIKVNYTDSEKEFIHYLYNDIFKEGIQDLSTIEQIDFFSSIRRVSLTNSSNKDFYFKEFVDNIFSSFTKRRLEIDNKILSGDIDKSELGYLDKFLTTNCISSTLYPDKSAKMLSFLNVIQSLDAENISNYQCFKHMTQSIINKSLANDKINPAYINYLIATIKEDNVYTNIFKYKIDNFILNNDSLNLIDFSNIEFNQLSKLYAYSKDESLSEEYRKKIGSLIEKTFIEMRENTDKCIPFLEKAFNEISSNDISDEDKAFIDSIFENVIKVASCNFKSFESIDNFRKYRSMIANLNGDGKKYFSDILIKNIYKEQSEFLSNFINPKIESGEIDSSEFKLFDELLSLESESFGIKPEKANKLTDFMKIVKEKDKDNLGNYNVFNNAAYYMIKQIGKKKEFAPEFENFLKEALSGDKVLNFSVIIQLDRGYLSRENDENKKNDYIKIRDSYFSRLLDKIQNSSISELDNFKDINKYIESYIEYAHKEDFFQKNKVAFDFICKYTETVLSKDSNALVNNDSFCHLYQLLQRDSSPKELRDSLDNIFSKYKSSHSVPNMDNYEEKISKFMPMSEEEFEKFASDLEQIKNALGIIPQKYCDYLISQKLDENSELNKNIDKYFNIFKRSFEDKAQYVLHDKGINNYKTKISKLQSKNYKTLYGRQDSSTLYLEYSEDALKDMSKDNATLIGTLFHEIQHVSQRRDMDIQSNEMTYLTYEMIKEDCLKDEVGFYKNNYKNMQIEIDARIAGVTSQVEYLKYLGLSDVEISNYEAKDLLGEGINKYLQMEKERADKAVKKIDSKGKVRYVDQIFQDLIQKKYKNLFEKYPILKMEFDDDGTRKGNLQILSEYVEKNAENGLSFDLCLHVLKNYSTIETEKMLDDTKLLATFEPKTKETKEARDMILRDTIIPFIEMQSKEGNRIPEMIQNVYEFIASNDDLDIFQEQKEFIAREYNEYVRDSKTQESEEKVVPMKPTEAQQISGEKDEIVFPGEDTETEVLIASEGEIAKEKEQLELKAFSIIDSTVTPTERRSAMLFVSSQLHRDDKSNEIKQDNEKNDEDFER